MRLVASLLIISGILYAQEPPALSDAQKVEVYEMLISLQQIDQQEQAAVADLEKQATAVREKAGRDRVVIQESLKAKVQSLSKEGWTLGPGLRWQRATPTTQPQSKSSAKTP